MEPNILMEYDRGNKIFIQKYSGYIFIEDIINSWESSIKDGQIPPGVKRFCLDYKNARIVFPTEKVLEIVRLYKRHNDVFEKSRMAMIMESPDQVVYSYLMESRLPQIKIKTFYTHDAAFHWLLS